MTFDQPPETTEAGPKKEYKISSEVLSDEHLLDEVFKLHDFKGIEDFFIEDRIGKISCSVTLEGNKIETLETNENEPIAATSFEEMKDNIQNWIVSEIKKLNEISRSPNWKIKSFTLSYSFEKEGQEVQAGGRSIINENF